VGDFGVVLVESGSNKEERIPGDVGAETPQHKHDRLSGHFSVDENPHSLEQGFQSGDFLSLFARLGNFFCVVSLINKNFILFK